jgi:hypothetical protein
MRLMRLARDVRHGGHPLRARSFASGRRSLASFAHAGRDDRPRVVFLERSPHVRWEAQRPAFASAAVDGVVHPNLPLWLPEDASDEPGPSSRAFLPKTARLAPRERAALLPKMHVQTVAASRFATRDDAAAFMRAAVEAGAGALLIVSGDGHNRTTTTAAPGRLRPPEQQLAAAAPRQCFSSATLLSLASEMRARGDFDFAERVPPVTLACVANPSLEGAAGVAALERKIALGAEMCVTQPALAPERHRAWRRAVRDAGLDRRVAVVHGAHASAAARTFAFWARLVLGRGVIGGGGGGGGGGLAAGARARGREVDEEDEEDEEDDGTRRREESAAGWAAAAAEVAAELRAWEAAEAALGGAASDGFRRWAAERAELALAEIATDPGAAGAHLMPVTEGGYEVAARLLARGGAADALFHGE